VIVIRHHWEAYKTTGTARLAELVLSNLAIWDLGNDPLPVRARLAPLEPGWLLYPGGAPLEAARRDVRHPPEWLIVLDGTWRQTRRMLRRLPELSRMPHVSLPHQAARRTRLRETPGPAARSTVEAIGEALAVLSTREEGGQLLRLYDLFVERTLLSRGKGPSGVATDPTRAP
jgi:DTW domain-containing protein YfiP